MKKFLVVGPAESAQYFCSDEYPGQIELDASVDIIGMHRVFPHLNIPLTYWTWSDPDASLEGLRVYISSKDETEFNKLPQIILPIYQKNLDMFRANCGTSPLEKDPSRQEERDFYHSALEWLDKLGKITWIKNAVNTKSIPHDHKIFKDPRLRFNGEHTYFGSVPFDGVSSRSNWAKENKFTSYMLPICHYLSATHVFCMGLDNVGIGINRTIPQSLNDPETIMSYLSKYPLWTRDWVGYHNMEIYSIVPDRFTPNNSVMEYVDIKDINNIKEVSVPVPFEVNPEIKDKLQNILENSDIRMHTRVKTKKHQYKQKWAKYQK